MDETVLSKAVTRASEILGKIELTASPDDGRLSDSDLYSFVVNALKGIALDKSPGYPLNLVFSTNKDALDCVRDEIIDAAICRLRLYLSDSFPFEEMELTPLGLILYGLDDPSSLFIKYEPHPARKAGIGQFRCISPVSLVTQLVQRALYSEMSKKRLRGIYTNGSAAGIGFSDSQLSETMEVVRTFNRDTGLPPTSIDFSGFDSMHNLQTMSAANRLNDIVLYSSYGLSSWHRADRRMTLSICKGYYIIGGTMYQKTDHGCMNSGAYITTLRNTELCILYSAYAAVSSGQVLQRILANGDDGVLWVERPEDLVTSAALVGMRLRGVKTYHNGGFEFCSHLYHDTTPVRASLLSWPKLCYRILTSTVEEGDALQALCETRHNSNYSRISSFVKSIAF